MRRLAAKEKYYANDGIEASDRSLLRPDFDGIVVKFFRYLQDPLFLACCGLYATNRWLIKPQVHSAFFHNWFNDLLLIPCALPPLLLAHRWLGLRSHDAAPTFLEVGCHLLGWSLLFEVIGPRLLPRATGDPLDLIAYSASAAIAILWWNRRNPSEAR